VDFRRGSLFEIKFTQPATEDKIRAVFEQFGLNNPSISRLGTDSDNLWQVRTDFLQGEQTQNLMTALSKQVAPVDQSGSSVSSVSEKVASEVTRAALIAVIGATIAILLFVWYAFRKAPNAIRYSVCAIVAMVHDILVVGGLTAIFSTLFGWEIDALFLTAMLTVIGFSVQDTIVVYDRIRENLTRRRGEDFHTIVSRSIVETIHRSLTISLTNIFVMTALLLFGGASIKQFVAVMLIGLVSGTYSSIFNAVPLVVAWEERSLLGRQGLAHSALPAK
jgi:preprotein translocase SecF subunit